MELIISSIFTFFESILKSTDVYVYLPADPEKLVEYLPIFNSKIEAYYKEKSKKSTWVSGKDSQIRFETNVWKKCPKLCRNFFVKTVILYEYIVRSRQIEYFFWII